MENFTSGREDRNEDECTSISEGDISVPTFSSSVNEPILINKKDTETSEKSTNQNMESVEYVPNEKEVTDVEVTETPNNEESKPDTTENMAHDGCVTFNLATVDLEVSEKTKEPAKDSNNYVSEFHKFLEEEKAAKGADSEVSSGHEGDEKAHEKNASSDPQSKVSKPFYPCSEDTSNSSWYKLKPDEDIPKTDSLGVGLPQDETSNLSLADNASCVSSNIGDGLSFHDHASNLDECSNLSIPDENSVIPYSGHQPVFDESANMNPPSNLPCARPDTPNSERDKNASDSTPAKKYRRGTLQIAADDANEHGQ